MCSFSRRARARKALPSRPTTNERSERTRRPSYHLGAAAAVCVLIAAVCTSGPDATRHPAGAVVVHELGFEATVNGWTSWYGAYGLGTLGWGWCVDHGAHAPDGDFGYVPTSLDGETPADIQAAMSWAATVNEPSDPVTAAATMLVLHDFRRASYPFGTIDVDAMTTANLAGFGGHEGDVLARARTIKADALAHAHFRAPFSLTVQATPVRPDQPGVATAVLTDAAGAAVPGMTVTLIGSGARVTTAPHQTTDAAGATSFEFIAAAGANDFVAWSVVPDPRPKVFASSTVVAQRIIQPARLDVSGAASFVAEVPTTTSTSTTTSTPSTTTTTAPTTTTTTRPTTTTTRRPTTTTSTTSTTSTTRPRSTSTTRPPTTTVPTTSSTSTSTSTSTTVPSTTIPATSTTTPTTTAPSPPVPRRSTGTLPVTGTRTWSLVLVAIGLVLCGGALRALAHRRRPAAPDGRP